MQLLGRENKQEQSKLALSSSLDRVIAVCARSLLPKQTAQTEQQQSSFLQKLFHPTRYQLERANRRETTDPLRNRLVSCRTPRLDASTHERVPVYDC